MTTLHIFVTVSNTSTCLGVKFPTSNLTTGQLVPLLTDLLVNSIHQAVQPRGEPLIPLTFPGAELHLVTARSPAAVWQAELILAVLCLASYPITSISRIFLMTVGDKETLKLTV